MKYFFILGKNYLLSTAEILNLLDFQEIRYVVKDLSTKVLILEIKDKFTAKEFLSRLGGTVKVGQVLPSKFELADLVEIVAKEKSGKINFGFSVYLKEDNVKPKRVKDLRFKIKDLSIKIKQNLREGGRSVRWVVSRDKNLSSVVVKTNKLIETGAEIVLLVGQRDLLVGQTLAVQEFEEYSSRDYGREYRDAKSGMIPPKLAKMMINLAGVPLSGKILDPFCGSGTVLQEALLIGCKDVLGSDISEKAVHDSRENLRWLLEKFQMSNVKCQTNSKFQMSNVKSEVQKIDVVKLSDNIKRNSIDAIVTEPYLGPSHLKRVKRIERISELGAIKKELVELYTKAFIEFKKVLKPGGRVVMVWPAWRVGGNRWKGSSKNSEKITYLPMINQVIDMGFKKVNILPKDVISDFNIKQNERKTLIYSRPDQVVLREIWCWQYRAPF